MERRVVLILAVVVLLVASVTAAVAVTLAADDDPWFGHRDGMMSLQRQDRGGQLSEYAYLAEMVAHHEEAVTAAQQLERSRRADLRDFGEDIVAAQTAQIDQMQQWLADWYPDRSGRVVYQPMMRDLTDLSGDRLDRTFLLDMTRHHMAAVMMSQQLLMHGVAEHDEVEALAETIRDEQHAEIFQMRQWLQEWFGGAATAGCSQR